MALFAGELTGKKGFGLFQAEAHCAVAPAASDSTFDVAGVMKSLCPDAIGASAGFIASHAAVKDKGKATTGLIAGNLADVGRTITINNSLLKNVHDWWVVTEIIMQGLGLAQPCRVPVLHLSRRLIHAYSRALAGI